MSWSVSAIGKSNAVKQEISKQFNQQSPCAEPEESVRQAAAKAIDAALAAFDDGQVVRVSASGHQIYKDWNTKTGISNNMNITVEPIGCFVE